MASNNIQPNLRLTAPVLPKAKEKSDRPPVQPAPPQLSSSTRANQHDRPPANSLAADLRSSKVLSRETRGASSALVDKFIQEYHLEPGTYQKGGFTYGQHHESVKKKLDVAPGLKPPFASLSRPHTAFPSEGLTARPPAEIVKMLKDQGISVVMNIDKQPNPNDQSKSVLPKEYADAFKKAGITYIDNPNLKMLDSSNESLDKKSGDLKKIVSEIQKYRDGGKGVAVFCAHGFGRSKVVQGAVMMEDAFKKGTLPDSELKETNVFKNNVSEFAKKHNVAPRVLLDAVKKHAPDFYNQVKAQLDPVKAYKGVAKTINTMRASNPFAIERDYNINLLNSYFESLHSSRATMRDELSTGGYDTAIDAFNDIFGEENYEKLRDMYQSAEKGSSGFRDIKFPDGSSMRIRKNGDARGWSTSGEQFLDWVSLGGFALGRLIGNGTGTTATHFSNNYTASVYDARGDLVHRGIKFHATVDLSLEPDRLAETDALTWGTPEIDEGWI